ncbi:MAG: LysR family transcriptional regulator [Halomonas sp.]|uniref:LysR family transcriptional regulator n=1 Tax=Halomonas sp. TaxID=1486246 RepID=UPI003F8DF541
MEIETARTFLEILRCGSFSAAGESLHVTQTTVTARIHRLEEQLGCRLLVRHRGGVSMTEHGKRFSEHAAQLVQVWETLQRELPLPVGIGQVLALGGELSLWNPLMMNWLSELRRSLPQLAVRMRVGERKELQEALAQGLMDAVLVHQADYWPGMQVELLQEEKLIMVQTPRANDATTYLYVDWGETFRREHDAALPHLASPVVMTNLGPLALQYLLANSGSGYFRLSAVQSYLEQGHLERVPQMPEFSYPVYLVHAREKQPALLIEALRVLNSQLDS